MKKLTILALALCGLALAACNSTGTATPDQLKAALANTQALVAAGCTIVQPTLAGTAAAVPDPKLGLAAGVNGVFCAANEAAASGAAAASAPVAASAAK